MKVIKYPNPNLADLEVTQLASDHAALVTTLTVINTTEFAVNDYIIIESVGNERCEMRQVLTIPTISTMTVAATSFAHGKLAPVRKSLFNKIRLYRSADNITYALIDTRDVDWQDMHNQAVFVDPTGSDSYWYKVEYYNTTSTLSQFSSPIKVPTIYGYLTVEQFKNLTKIEGEDEFIAQALDCGAKQIRIKLYAPGKFVTTARGLTQEINTENLEFADANLDGKINKEDFVVYEQAPDGTRTYVSSDITGIDIDRRILTFGSEHPTGSKSLAVEYFGTQRQLEDYAAIVERLNTLYAVNYIFQNIPFRRMQRGISNWSINSVTVTLDLTGLKGIVDANKKEINALIQNWQCVFTRGTTGRAPTIKRYTFIKSTLQTVPDTP